MICSRLTYKLSLVVEASPTMLTKNTKLAPAVTVATDGVVNGFNVAV